eukprot:gi/632976474/ref/XP_007904814.1/ PREDICTED: uncharacterized protein LOC103187221 [Callorhinchus milii]
MVETGHRISQHPYIKRSLQPDPALCLGSGPLTCSLRGRSLRHLLGRQLHASHAPERVAAAPANCSLVPAGELRDCLTQCPHAPVTGLRLRPEPEAGPCLRRCEAVYTITQARWVTAPHCPPGYWRTSPPSSCSNPGSLWDTGRRNLVMQFRSMAPPLPGSPRPSMLPWKWTGKPGTQRPPGYWKTAALTVVPPVLSGCHSEWNRHNVREQTRAGPRVQSDITGHCPPLLGLCRLRMQTRIFVVSGKSEGSHISTD